MIDQRPSDIEQAPSVDDITSSDERVGRVDFNRRLRNRRDDVVDVGSPGDSDDPSDPAGDLGDGADEGEDNHRGGHLLILPPAKVEAILAAEAAKLDAEGPTGTGTPAGGSGSQGGHGPDADRELALGRSVEDVAASIIAAMRSTAEAHGRHLEAIEAEAARRGELALAQAELDAELIRLNGRREAHAIIATARARTGGSGAESRTEATRLQEIGETFSRFAETIETAVATPPPDPGDDGTT